MEMWLRFATCGSVASVDACQAYYRVHGKNMHIETYGTTLADLQQRTLVFKILFEQHRDRIPEWERLQAQANRRLAQELFYAANEAFDQGDVATCRRALGLALESDRSVQNSPGWARLRWKRLVGPKVSSLVRSVAGWLRGRPSKAWQSPR
jgi:hypothetical protein